MRMSFNRKGFTLIELLIVFAIVSIICAIVGGGIFGGQLTRGKTEAQAYEGMVKFVAMNGLQDQIARKTCASDTDGDGYGSCTLVLKTSERIYLQCPTGFWYKGADSCKEVPAINIQSFPNQ